MKSNFRKAVKLFKFIVAKTKDITKFSFKLKKNCLNIYCIVERNYLATPITLKFVRIYFNNAVFL